MTKLKTIQKDPITTKDKKLRIERMRILTKESYKNKAKGIKESVPMTYDEALKAVNDIKFVKGKKYVVSFLYNVGWRSGGFFDGTKPQVSDNIDFYDDDGGDYTDVYAIDIKTLEPLK